MKDRPKIHIALTTTDKLISYLAWAILIGTWVLAIISYTDLPETIATHYNAKGVADGFGQKHSIFFLPLVGTVLFIVLSFLDKKPHLFNYPTTITQENALRQYTNALKLLRILKLAIVLVFGIILVKTIQHAKGNADGLGTWFLPLIIALFLLPTGYFMIQSLKKI